MPISSKVGNRKGPAVSTELKPLALKLSLPFLRSRHLLAWQGPKSKSTLWFISVNKIELQAWKSLFQKS